ncbi:peptidoglycan-binding protein [Lyngbya sp. CCY1209]|uniref:peptidoglycan-binding domain-containing protein n=1 Tax=Lyngbya sp. CCY1209 TaxID=2886103 RepID=UPI002D20A111|nr:peptidoglycan-binding protein [Lyngbya sp. CCY1209]MEB3885042.1 peptidoglycan-binding protein [Lyngbya sp. CCY1209]
MMDSYAYLHLALSYENPPHFHLANPMGIRWKKLSTRADRGFLSLAVTLAVLSLAQAAQALVAIGDFGSEVTRIQNRLSELGYFTSNTTGYFGDITQNAVIQFQRDNGLVQDGIVGPNTLAALFGTDSPADPTPPVSDRDLIGLGVGDSGPGVTNLQNRLRNLGYFTANSTGYFGQITRNAVIRFQQDNFISATGLVSEETLALLNQRPVPLPEIGLGPGSTGSAVGGIQRVLRQLGFYRGPITNVFDQATARAVRNFQIAYGLPPTGRVEAATQALLVSWGVVVPGTPSVPSFPSNPPNSPPILVVGNRGTAVLLLQRRLQQLGYYTGTVDGIFDESTRRAVIGFQRAYGIPPTGRVDATTQFYLVRVLARTTTVSQIPQVPAVTVSPVRPVVTPSVSLTVGDTGMGVRRIQRRLRELNFYDGPINGFFDGGTQMAVMRFQQAYNITTTGIVGPTTEAYLFNLNRRIFSYITPSVAAASSDASDTRVETHSAAIASSDASDTRVETHSAAIAASAAADTPVNVAALQERLKIQGLYSGPINGLYDALTQSAVAKAKELYGASAEAVLYSGL